MSTHLHKTCQLGNKQSMCIHPFYNKVVSVSTCQTHNRRKHQDRNGYCIPNAPSVWEDIKRRLPCSRVKYMGNLSLAAM